MTMDVVLMGLESLKQFTNTDGKKQIAGLQDGIRTMGRKTVVVGKTVLTLQALANDQAQNVFLL